MALHLQDSDSTEATQSGRFFFYHNYIVVKYMYIWYNKLIR